MKQFFVIPFLILLSCGQNITKHKKPESKELELIQNTLSYNIETDIIEIKNEYKRINSLKLTQKTVQLLPNQEHCVDERTIKYFSENNKIVKIVDIGWFADDGWKNEYYYKNEKLFFLYEEGEGGPINGPRKKTEYRIYIKADTIIRFIENTKIIQPPFAYIKVVENGIKIYKSFKTKEYPSVLCN